jgi:hypothetical protein
MLKCLCIVRIASWSTSRDGSRQWWTYTSICPGYPIQEATERTHLFWGYRQHFAHFCLAALNLGFFLGAFAQLRNATISFFIKFYIWAFFENLSRKFKLISNLIRITSTHMKTYVHLWQYLAELNSEREMLQTQIVEKIKTHIECLITSFRKLYHLWDNVEKYDTARQTTYGACALRGGYLRLQTHAHFI